MNLNINSPNKEQIEYLISKGWSYLGQCACKVKMDKITKTVNGVRYEVKIEVNKDRWQLHKWNNGIIASGNKMTLAGTIDGIK